MPEYEITWFLQWREAVEFALFCREVLDEKQRVYRHVCPEGRWAVVDGRARV